MNALKNRLIATSYHHPGTLYQNGCFPKTFKKIILAAKWLARHSSTSINLSNDLCLLFCIYPSSLSWGKRVEAGQCPEWACQRRGRATTLLNMTPTPLPPPHPHSAEVLHGPIWFSCDIRNHAKLCEATRI